MIWWRYHCWFLLLLEEDRYFWLDSKNADICAMPLTVVKTWVIITKHKKINLQWSGRINLSLQHTMLHTWAKHWSWEYRLTFLPWVTLWKPTTILLGQVLSQLVTHISSFPSSALGVALRRTICDCMSCTLLLKSCINLPGTPNLQSKKDDTNRGDDIAGRPSSSQQLWGPWVEDAKKCYFFLFLFSFYFFLII